MASIYIIGLAVSHVVDLEYHRGCVHIPFLDRARKKHTQRWKTLFK